MIHHRGTEIIETDRLILRPFALEDADDMYDNWAKDPEVSRYLTWTAHPNVEATRSLVGLWVESYSCKETYHWGIGCRDMGGRLIGSMAVVKANTDLAHAEIGYCLSRGRWNQGIVTEALSAVIHYLFDCGFTRITAYHDILNPASGRVMQKCGMRFECTISNTYRNNQGVLCDVDQYAISRPDRGSENEDNVPSTTE